MRLWLRLLAAELRRAGDPGQSLVLVAFYTLAAILFPFGVGSEPQLLATVAPGVLWVAVLLAVLLSLEPMFARDFADGSLELWVLQPLPLAAAVLARITAQWLAVLAPLLFATPLLAPALQLPAPALAILAAALALGTPALTALAAVGAALILGARRGGVLLVLVILPLYVPVLIFGSGAVTEVLRGAPAAPALMLLAACSLVALALAPPATAAAVRQALQ